LPAPGRTTAPRDQAHHEKGKSWRGRIPPRGFSGGRPRAGGASPRGPGGRVAPPRRSHPGSGTLWRAGGPLPGGRGRLPRRAVAGAYTFGPGGAPRPCTPDRGSGWLAPARRRGGTAAWPGHSPVTRSSAAWSPEQAEMNAFGVDTRSDIYALGELLYVPW